MLLTRRLPITQRDYTVNYLPATGIQPNIQDK